MDPASALLDELSVTLGVSAADALAWLRGWARVLPTVVLVPAFGLRSVARPVRAGLALALGIAISPAIRPSATSGGAWLVELALDVARGLPVALSAAVALWTASMLGGVLDDLRGERGHTTLGNVEAGTSPTGALVAMLAALVFLESGGAGRVAEALIAPGVELQGSFGRAATELGRGIQLAIALATPLIVASIVVEVAGALIARAASPASIQPLLAPVRSLSLLAIAALLLDRIVALLALMAMRVP